MERTERCASEAWTSVYTFLWRGVAVGAVPCVLCSAGDNKQLTQNWYGPGESDCLIKTKHCDSDNFALTQCDFCPVL